MLNDPQIKQTKSSSQATKFTSNKKLKRSFSETPSQDTVLTANKKLKRSFSESSSQEFSLSKVLKKSFSEENNSENELAKKFFSQDSEFSSNKKLKLRLSGNNSQYESSNENQYYKEEYSQNFFYNKSLSNSQEETDKKKKKRYALGTGYETENNKIFTTSQSSQWKLESKERRAYYFDFDLCLTIHHVGDWLEQWLALENEYKKTKGLPAVTRTAPTREQCAMILKPFVIETLRSLLNNNDCVAIITNGTGYRVKWILEGAGLSVEEIEKIKICAADSPLYIEEGFKSGAIWQLLEEEEWDYIRTHSFYDDREIFCNEVRELEEDFDRLGKTLNVHQVDPTDHSFLEQILFALKEEKVENESFPVLELEKKSSIGLRRSNSELFNQPAEDLKKSDNHSVFFKDEVNCNVEPQSISYTDESESNIEVINTPCSFINGKF